MLFSQFGELERIKQFPERGYCFVVFANLSEAIWCREQMAAYPPLLHNRQLQVNYGRARVGCPRDLLAKRVF